MTTLARSKMSRSEAEDILAVFIAGFQVDVDILRAASRIMRASFPQLLWAHNDAFHTYHYRRVAEA